MSWPELPDIVLIGHSLGGAVVVDLAHKALLDSAVLGYAVLDVVEGSAMEALTHMETYLSSRPSTFPSLASAIEWQYALSLLIYRSRALVLTDQGSFLALAPEQSAIRCPPAYPSPLCSSAYPPTPKPQHQSRSPPPPPPPSPPPPSPLPPDPTPPPQQRHIPGAPPFNPPAPSGRPGSPTSAPNSSPPRPPNSSSWPAPTVSTRNS